ILRRLNPSVLWLHELRARDAPLVGGKAANLGELLGKGFPVPPGFVVASDAYARFLESNGIDAELRAWREAPAADTARACAEVRARIAAAELPPDLAEAILALHRRLLADHGDSLQCAVRS